MSRRITPARVLLATGVALIVAGTAIVVPALSSRWRGSQQVSARQGNDESALHAWRSGGSDALAGAAAGASPAVATPAAGACAGGSGGYALVQFTGLPTYGYAGVAVDGNWTALDDHSMVHWYGSPAPGGAGDVIIAFHREPDFQHIDLLAPGETVTVQSADCTRYVYTVTRRWVLAPGAVTQLVPTPGHELTLITCTPWWQDYDRLVWRADLTAVEGPAPGGTPAP